MSSFIVYSCPCYNIRIHLSTKYIDKDFEELKSKSSVQTPATGWEFELGMGGIVTGFSSLIQSKSGPSSWKTFSCLNCDGGDVYSIADQTSSSHVIIHENAIYGKDIEKLKQDKEFSDIFKIKFSNNTLNNSIPMPSAEDVPGKLVSTHNQMQAIMEQSAEKLRLDSKARIEEFKQQEEKKLQESLSKAKQENNRLWSKIIQVTNNQTDNKKEKSHVRFAPVVEEDQKSNPSIKKPSFALDESAISSSLRNVNLDYPSNLKLNLENHSANEEEEEEEDMFNLDEEFSDEEKESYQIKDSKESEDEDDKDKENEPDNSDKKVKNQDHLISSSLKKSISEIDQKFSWIKKKRNTNKYLTQDFDIKSGNRKDSINEEEPSAVSMFATSVPIAIHYPAVEEEKKDDGDENSIPKKKDILASSFANYDFSYSDRMLSEQFPAPRRRKSLASSSLINPQLDSLVGKSLDTRGLMKKKKNEAEPKDDKEEFDSSLPPHIWAAMESIDE